MSVEKNEMRLPERRSVVYVFYENGKVLMEDRIDPSKPFWGYKIFPGGKVEEIDPDYDSAVDREVVEECGVKVINKVELGRYLHITPTHMFYDTKAYLITEYEGMIKNIENKHKQFWVSLDEAQNLAEFAETKYVLLLAKDFLFR